MPGMTSSVLTRQTYTKVVSEPLRRGRRLRLSRGGWPPGRKSGPGSIVRQIPVKPRSNSSREIRLGPEAGSFSHTRPRR